MNTIVFYALYIYTWLKRAFIRKLLKYVEYIPDCFYRYLMPSHSPVGANIKLYTKNGYSKNLTNQLLFMIHYDKDFNLDHIFQWLKSKKVCEIDVEKTDNTKTVLLVKEQDFIDVLTYEPYEFDFDMFYFA